MTQGHAGLGATGPNAGSPVARWVSGGQTGVDRALLDAAVAAGMAYGGWCPAGGWAEDLPDPPGLLALYPGLAPTPDGDPARRTAWNVRDSDATLVLTVGVATSRGVDRTVAEARRLGRPVLIDPDELGRLTEPTAGAVREGTVVVAAADRIEEWLLRLAGTAQGAIVVNVAGPRESESPGAYDATFALLSVVIRRLTAP